MWILITMNKSKSDRWAWTSWSSQSFYHLDFGSWSFREHRLLEQVRQKVSWLVLRLIVSHQSTVQLGWDLVIVNDFCFHIHNDTDLNVCYALHALQYTDGQRRKSSLVWTEKEKWEWMTKRGRERHSARHYWECLLRVFEVRDYHTEADSKSSINGNLQWDMWVKFLSHCIIFTSY